ncbi:flagellin [Bacillaceae bacterium SAOS 7]|nr:flagellin [Bacillaceae bacterium SAOS 7]
MKIQNQSMIAFSMNRYQKNETKIQKTIDKLASGLDIQKAADNASGLVVSETMRAQIRGISQAQKNMQDGLSVLEATDEGLNHVNSLLHRARELSVMAANDTLTQEDRQAAQVELEELMSGINDTAEKLEFNTKKILGENAPLVLMVGANPGQQIKIDLVKTDTDTLGLAGASLLTQNDAENLITKVDDAITKVSLDLTRAGSHYEAVEHHIRNAHIYEKNMTTSFSMLKDADMGREMLSFTTTEIRQKSDQILVSTVNQNAKDVLNLFK